MIKLKELLFLQQIRGFGKVKINKYLDIIYKSQDLDHLSDTVLDKEKIGETELVEAKNAAGKKYEELESMQDLKVITVFDLEYPKGFQALGNKKPLILYAKGDTSILNKPGISVVGTRHPSAWTKKFGENVSKQMALISGRIVVSGLALGCDRFAHEGAMKAGVPTVAVLPSGVNVITPASHKDLANRIIEKGGCLISEYTPDAPAFKTTYPERDALIAAMTDITYVIECQEKSGTFYAVNAAYMLGKRLGCYYPNESDLRKGARLMDYLGNKKMIDQMGAITISRDKELNSFFEAEPVQEDKDNTIINQKDDQMSLLDFGIDVSKK